MQKVLRSINKNIIFWSFINSQLLQGCALAEPGGPWCLTFALRRLENNLRFFIQIICWAPLILQFHGTRLPSIFLRVQPWLIILVQRPVWRICMWILGLRRRVAVQLMQCKCTSKSRYGGLGFKPHPSHCFHLYSKNFTALSPKCTKSVPATYMYR